ncbi:hypothetical protein Drose_21235 [Dactylosporangium roseum]|uniref:Uncharacterized protein n=1 Tax=Dactylosporangium roseum TaxID=47989 RepID=A0ABY5YYZ9_9ACTN|nr:hypothetical protein [Dactylosporangium roseum]UWZ33798.1 hypothetical protein Drose_21235 [Dactylosporangium roseum]
MQIEVVSLRRSAASLAAAFPGAAVVDVTSKDPQPWVRPSPLHPHGGVPAPFPPGRTAMSATPLSPRHADPPPPDRHLARRARQPSDVDTGRAAVVAAA